MYRHTNSKEHLIKRAFYNIPDEKYIKAPNLEEAIEQQRELNKLKKKRKIRKPKRSNMIDRLQQYNYYISEYYSFRKNYIRESNKRRSMVDVHDRNYQRLMKIAFNLLEGSKSFLFDYCVF